MRGRVDGPVKKRLGRARARCSRIAGQVGYLHSGAAPESVQFTCRGVRGIALLILFETLD
jgi:hypothetical protein